MRESIVIGIAPVIVVIHTGNWHAATAGAEHSRLAPSSVLHNLYLKYRQLGNIAFDWKHESVMPSVGAA